jgi:outer membrane lipoprotein-sorting protein
MKKATIILAGISALLLLSGCGQSPSKVAMAFSEEMAKGNITEAKKYATEQTGQLLDMVASMGAMDTEPDAKFKVTKETIDGSHATVKIEKDGDEEEMDLVKIDGKWKVDVKKDE